MSFAESDFLKFLSGSGILLGVLVILSLGGKVLKVTTKWFRPGTWLVIVFHVAGCYMSAFAKGLDAFVIAYRQAKNELMEEILECEQ